MIATRHALLAALCLGVFACGDDAAGGTGETCLQEIDGGCPLTAYAHDADTLYTVRLPSGEVTVVAPLATPQGLPILDLALSPDDKLYGLTLGGVWAIDRHTGGATEFLPGQIGSDFTGMDIGADGRFFTAQGNDILAVGPPGTGWKYIVFPPGTGATGDVAFLGQRLFVLGSDQKIAGSDVLLELDLQDRAKSVVVGPTGFTCVVGLVGHDKQLYGLTCKGEVLAIDPDSGAAQLLRQTKVAFAGAAGR